LTKRWVRHGVPGVRRERLRRDARQDDVDVAAAAGGVESIQHAAKDISESRTAFAVLL
jgi:hypothetical protein